MAKRNTGKSVKRRPGRPRKSQKQAAFEKMVRTRIGLLVGLTLFVSLGLIILKTPVFKFLVSVLTYEANESSEPESRVDDAINLSFEIRNSDYKREQLFALLSDPVEWYNRTRRLNGRFPSSAEYDLFRYLAKPEVEEIDFVGNNYEINFHGVYRYRRPKNQLLAFESGIAFMEGGLITSLTTESVPNEYHLDWVNKLWRWYPLFCVGITFIALLIILFGKVEKSLLFDLIRKRVGLG
ncbi:MAG: hypothetical protein H6557_17745 [Lewinellaceae bacterium]|nr:hypothetical protein [Phaeodactylibacter sp.]MCB9038457.1 hypothetical protein [Lewinellaceae bacterium]